MMLNFLRNRVCGAKKGGTMGKSSIAIDVVHKKQESLSASCCDR